MKWTIDWNTKKREIDTGNNDAEGNRMKYNRLGTMKFTLEAEGIEIPTVASVHVNDNDSIMGLAKKIKGLGSRLETFARKAAKEGFQPFRKEVAGTPLGEALEDLLEIAHDKS